MVTEVFGAAWACYGRACGLMKEKGITYAAARLMALEEFSSRLHCSRAWMFMDQLELKLYLDAELRKAEAIALEWIKREARSGWERESPTPRPSEPRPAPSRRRGTRSRSGGLR